MHGGNNRVSDQIIIQYEQCCVLYKTKNTHSIYEEILSIQVPHYRLYFMNIVVQYLNGLNH